MSGEAQQDVALMDGPVSALELDAGCCYGAATSMTWENNHETKKLQYTLVEVGEESVGRRWLHPRREMGQLPI